MLLQQLETAKYRAGKKEAMKQIDYGSVGRLFLLVCVGRCSPSHVRFIIAYFLSYSLCSYAFGFGLVLVFCCCLAWSWVFNFLFFETAVYVLVSHILFIVGGCSRGDSRLRQVCSG